MYSIQFEYEGYLFEFETSKKLFSPAKIDDGTIAMLSKVKLYLNDKILDLGCGYSVVGIIIGKVFKKIGLRIKS